MADDGNVFDTEAENRLIAPEPYTGISLGIVKYGEKKLLKQNVHEQCIMVISSKT